MSEQKKYIFTSDYTTLSGEVINKEGEVIGFSPTMTIGEIDHLLNAGILVDYQEPITSDKVEALEKELNESNKALISLTKLYCYQSVRLEELKNDRDLNTAGTHVDPSAFEPGGFMNQPSEKIKDTATNATNNPATT